MKSYPQRRNQTSFRLGHKRSPESIEKQRKTLKAQYARGERQPMIPLGGPVSPEIILKRRITRRLNCLGSRQKAYSGGKQYWRILTFAGWKYEHRLVMEAHLGRKLDTKEHVHHKNGDGLDNRLDNLEVLMASEHAREHWDERKDQMAALSLLAVKLRPGQWAKKFDCCVKCGLTTSPHAAKGVCYRCYMHRYR